MFTAPSPARHPYRRLFRCLFASAFALAAWPARADVRLPAIFGDHMVLQQGAKLPIWGWADPGEHVTASFAGASASTVATPAGAWQINLPPAAASDEGRILTVKGRNSLSFQDVLVGDVWIASGQSNMQFGIQMEDHAAETIPAAKDSQLRFFVVPVATSLDPKNDIGPIRPGTLEGKWEVCTPDLMKARIGWNGISAAGYYFGKEIRRARGCPVGVIATYVGGTPAQAWTSIPALEKVPSLIDYVDAHQQLLNGYAKAEAAFPPKQAAFYQAMKEWSAKVSPALNQWKNAVAQAQAAGQTPPPEPRLAFPRPPQPNSPDGGAGAPGNLFNAMVAPVIPYGIKGVIWYQGEANADTLDQAVLYQTLFPTMIEDWRRQWGQGNFPFLYVQLAGFSSGGETVDGIWPWLRESQMKTLSLPDTGMASAVDIGDPKNIHPKDKLDVGLRLALVARQVAYGENIEGSGPAYRSATAQAGRVRVSFDQPVLIGRPPWSASGAVPPAAATPTGFLIAGADGKFLPAQAALDQGSAIVWNDGVPKPLAVRYDWSNTPDGNLYNREGLPALPFRTDNWEPGPIDNLAITPEPGRGAPWMQKFRDNVTRSKGAKIDLIFDGDSITDWFQTTGKPVWQKAYTPRNAFDFAIAGDKTDNLLWRLDHGQLDGLHPKLIVLLIGTNNTIRDSTAQIAAGIQACVDGYLQRCPDAHVLLLSLFPRRTLNDPLRVKVNEVNARLAAMHFDDRVTLLDIDRIFLDDTQAIKLDLMPGRLHPNEVGYEAWASAIEPVIARYLPAPGAPVH
ncbi:MAG TPA: GDSL-type esterase/lipase family protein [Chthoniobacteraceae bacterium]|jgi:sialate O-acetylesterase|nr:GDSL-type esterase/lipase family protein [Chthoniobacteraceae bacterium]